MVKNASQTAQHVVARCKMQMGTTYTYQLIPISEHHLQEYLHIAQILARLNGRILRKWRKIKLRTL